MEARRQFIEPQIGNQRTLTEYHRSQADLERDVGSPEGQMLAPESEGMAIEATEP